MYYPLKALRAYHLTTLKRAKIAVIPRATKMIVGNQPAIVVPKLFTNVVSQVVKSAGIWIVPLQSIFSIPTRTKSHIAQQIELK